MSGQRRVRRAWRELAGTGTAAGISLALLVAVSVFVAVASAGATQTVATRALRAGLTRLSPVDKAVLGTLDLDQAGFGGPVQNGDLALLRGELQHNLTAAGLPLASHKSDWSGLTTAYVPVNAGARRAYQAGVPPQLEILYRDSLGRYIRHLTGHLPATATTRKGRQVFQVALTAATARRLGVTIGSRIGLEPSLTLVVTGIFQPARPGSAFWNVDPTAPAPNLNKVDKGALYWAGAVFVGPAELTLLEAHTNVSAVELSWGFPLNLRRLTAAQSGPVRNALSGASMQQVGQVSVTPPVQVLLSSSVAGYLGTFAKEQSAVGSVLDLLVVSLAAIGIVVVLLGALLLAEQRRGEFALLRARGAARAQLAGLALRAAALVAVPAAVVAAAVGVALTHGAGGPLGWWLGGLTLAAALISLPLLTVARLPRTRRSRTTSARTLRRRSAARRLVIEAALVAGAVGGLIVARQQGISGPDPLTSAAPVLVAIPAGVLAVRLYPVLARGLLRAAGLRNGAVAYLGFARAARTSMITALPAFALVLVLAVISFGGMVRAAVNRGEVAASWQQVGADAVLNTEPAQPSWSPAIQRAIAAVPGVHRLASISLTSGSTAGGTLVAIAVVQPRQYAALVAATPGPAFPAGALLRRAGGRVPAIATPAAVSALGGTDVRLGVGLLSQSLNIAVVKTAAAAPAISAASGPALLIMPQWGMHGIAPPPTLMLAAGPVDGHRLRAVVSRVVPGTVITLRSAALGVLARAPLPHGTYEAYAAGALVAVGFGILALLIWLLLSAAPREAALARLAAMGLSARQGSWLVLAEALPEIVVAVVAGTACAWALVSVVGPDLSLAAFTGSGAGVPIQAEPATLAIAAAGLLVVAVATLVGQALVTGRRGVTRALRIGE
jgi:putative ABC transport system permease protein